MRTVKRAVASAKCEAAMRQVPAGNLVIGLQRCGQRFPAFFQNGRFLSSDRVSKRVPSHLPLRSGIRCSGAEAHCAILPTSSMSMRYSKTVYGAGAHSDAHSLGNAASSTPAMSGSRIDHDSFWRRHTPVGKTKRLGLVLRLVAMALVSHSAFGAAVWIDCDLALGSPIRDADDGYALMLALHNPELRIVGVSTSYGNGTVSAATRRAKQIVARYGVRSSPSRIYSGAKSARAIGEETDATRALARAVHAESELTYLALGPLTNLATFQLRHPELARKIRGVVIVAGKSEGVTHRFGPAQSLEIGDANPAKDPVAARLVLTSTASVLLAPVHVGRDLVLRSADFRAMEKRSDAGRFLAQKSRAWFWFWNRLVRNDGAPMFDALAIAAVTHPRFVRKEIRYAEIDSKGNLTLRDYRTPNARKVHACVDVDPRLLPTILERLAATPVPSAHRSAPNRNPDS